MAEQKEVNKDLFEAGLEQQAETLVQSLEKANVPMQDRAKVKEWVKAYVRKGFTTIEIAQALKAHNYDFQNASSYLDKNYETKKLSKEAIQGVQEIKKQKAEEEKTKKRSSQVTWIVSSFLLGGVGLFMALMLGKQNQELSGTGVDLGMATSMLDTLVKGSWIMAIVGGIVGLFLLVLTLSSYFKEKNKEKGMNQSEIEAKKKEIESNLGQQQTQNVAQQTKTEPQQNRMQLPQQAQTSEKLQTQTKETLQQKQ